MLQQNKGLIFLLHCYRKPFAQAICFYRPKASNAEQLKISVLVITLKAFVNSRECVVMSVIITYCPQQEDYWLGKRSSCKQTPTHKKTDPHKADCVTSLSTSRGIILPFSSKSPLLHSNKFENLKKVL